jgi:hypothetical protein
VTGPLIPVAGLFSGFVGFSEILLLYAKGLMLAIPALILACVSLYCFWTLHKVIYKDLPKKLYILVGYLGVALLSLDTAVNFMLPIEDALMSDSQPTLSLEISWGLFFIAFVPASFLLLLFVFVRNKHAVGLNNK